MNKYRPTSYGPRDMVESGRNVAKEVHFRAEDACLQVGGKVTNYDDMLKATAHVLKEDPKLARAYFTDPTQDMNEVNAHG
jgi:hypothetical protein